MTYPVTTIGDVGKSCGCATTPSNTKMGAIEDLTAIVNPLGWLASQVGKKIAEQLTGKGKSAEPGTIDLIAKELGVDPIELVISVAGYSGWGRLWPGLKVVGGIVAVAGVAVAASRLASSRPKKGKK